MVRAIPDRDREQYCDVGSSLLIKIVVCSSLLLAIFHLHLRSRFENQSLPVISAAGGGANQPATVFSSPINPTLLGASDGSLPLMKIKTAEGMSASGPIMWKCQMSCARLSTHRTWHASASPAPLQAQLHLLALDDTPRQIPPEEHSVFSREDALGPTDGARLRVPHPPPLPCSATGIDCEQDHVYRHGVDCEQGHLGCAAGISNHHCLYQRAMLGINTSALEPKPLHLMSSAPVVECYAPHASLVPIVARTISDRYSEHLLESLRGATRVAEEPPEYGDSIIHLGRGPWRSNPKIIRSPGHQHHQIIWPPSRAIPLPSSRRAIPPSGISSTSWAQP